MLKEGQVRIPSGCAIAAVIARDGEKMSGRPIIEAMKPMHDRSNGLGGGFAAYGIYPEYKDLYALHYFFDERATRKNCEVFLKERFEIVKSEIIPTKKYHPLPTSPSSGVTSLLPCVPCLIPCSLTKRNLSFVPS